MGERFGDYELIRKIAAGGMAEIFLARLNTSDGFGRPVVVKRMLPQLAVRDDFVTMFLDEARLAANLTHPNIVQVFNLGEHDGAYFMAMELIDGPHLGALFAHSLRRRNALPIEFCAFAVARSADGLDYAHDRTDPATGLPLNIVHRDISPQNILVSRQGDVKVTDFGVAKAETQESKTRTGIIKGKVSYMSPEQCLGDKVNRQTDVFALGIVLYELLTRRRLFRDKSDMLVMQRITNNDVAPPSTVNAKIDDELDTICQRALARDKAARYQSAAELSEALDIWLVAKGYTSVKTKLSRWMGEHAAELGLQIDGEVSDPGSRPSWMDMQVEDTPHPGTPQEGTASTPALQAVGTASGLPQRKIGATDSGEATLVADEPTIIDPSLSPLLDLTDQEHSVDATSTESDAKPGPLSGVHRHAPAPAVDPEEAKRPMAALLGGGVALAIAVLVGVFVLGSSGEPEPLVVDPPDPTAEVDPGPEASGDGDARPPDDDPVADDPIDGTPSGDDDSDAPGGDADPKDPRNADADDDAPDKVDPDGADTKNPEAAAPAGPILKVKTVPKGVPVEVGEDLGRSPWEGAPGSGKITVRALFATGAVTRDVLIDKQDQSITLYESVPLDVKVSPASASWEVKGPGVDITGTGAKPLAARLEVGGRYAVVADAAGYEDASKTVVAKAGKKAVVELKLAKARSRTSARRARRSPQPRGNGTLVLFSQPHVKVKVAGKTVDSPVRGLTLSARSHRVTVFNPSLGINESFRVVIDKNKETRVKLRWEMKGGQYARTKRDIGKPQ